MSDHDEGTGSRVGRLLEKAREERGLSRAAVQSELGWPGTRPGDAVNALERLVDMPKLDRALRYASLLGVPLEEVARAVGVEPAPERTSSALVVQHVLAASGWPMEHMAAILGVALGDVEAWVDGSERLPDDVAKRLLLVLPIRTQIAADLDAQAESLSRINRNARATSEDGARRRRLGDS